MYLNRPRTTAVLCAIALAVFAVPVFGATLIWNDATGNWFTAGNWTPAGPPTATDDAQINNGGTAQVAAAGAAVKNFYLGFGVPDSGSLSVSGVGTLTASGLFLAVGESGTGTLSIASGGTVTDGDGLVGHVLLGSSGTVTVDGAGSKWINTGNLVVGYNGGGTLHITNGAVVSNATGAAVGFDAGAIGLVTVDGAGSKWTAGIDLIVADAGTGTLNITNSGVVSNATQSLIGHYTGSSGMVTVDGTGSQWTTTGTLMIADNGTGTLDITNGGAVSNTTGTVANSAGGTGTVTVDGAGSTWTNSGTLDVGEAGAGTLRITNGGMVSAGIVFIADQAGSTGVVNVDGSGSILKTVSAGIGIGYFGTGALNITNGGLVMNAGNGQAGSQLGSIGTVNVDGAGSQWMNGGNIGIGSAGVGFLNITNGGLVSNVDGFVGDSFPSGVGTVTVDGVNSTWANSGNLTIGEPGSGLLMIENGGAVTAGGTITIKNNGTVIDDAALTSVGGVSILNGGFLGGTGTVFGNVNNSGIVSPGDTGPGTFTITGNYTQNSDGTLKIEIGGLNSGVNSDLLNVNGAGGSALDGTLQLIRINNFKPAPGDRVTIINDPSGHTGMFSTLDLVNWGLIRPVPMYDEPTDVYVVFELGSFTSVPGLTFNQNAVAVALDQAFANACLPTSTFTILGNEPIAALPHIFDAIAPEEFAAMYEMSFSRAVVQSGNLQRRMDQIRENADPNCGLIAEINPPIQEGKNVVSKNVVPPAPPLAPDNRWGTFAMGSGDYVTVHNGDDNADGYRITNGSFLAGVDYRLLHNLAIGVYGGYVGSESDLVGGGRIITDGGTVGGYATFFSHGFYLQAAGGGGWNSYENRREAFLGGAQSSTDGSEVNAMGALGYDWTMNFNAANHPGSLTAGPIASVQYTNVDIDGFRERGSLIPLAFPDQSEDSLRSTIGGKLAICIQTDHGIMLRPEARVAWLHEYNDRAYPIDARFIGCPDIFTVHGPRIGEDAAQVNAGLTVQFNPMVALFAHYEGIFGRNNYDSNGVSGGLSISF